MLVLYVRLGDIQNLAAARSNGDQWPQVHALADQRGLGAVFPEDPLKSDASATGSLIHQVNRNTGSVAIRAANCEGWGDEPPDAVDALTELRLTEVKPPDGQALGQQTHKHDCPLPFTHSTSPSRLRVPTPTGCRETRR